MSFIANLFARRSRRRVRRPSLNLLRLEDRIVPFVSSISATIVPIGVTPDNQTTYSTINAALPMIGHIVSVSPSRPGPTFLAPDIIMLPGAGASSPPITVAGLTIEGDRNSPSSILPALNLEIQANNVALRNLNLASVIIDSNITGTTIIGSTVGSITVQGGASSGNTFISQNYITGAVSLGQPAVTLSGGTPTLGPAGSNSDRLLYNTFAGFSNPQLLLEQDNNAVVQFNTFTGAGSIATTSSGVIPGAPQTAIAVQSSQNIRITNNTIHLAGDTVPAGAPGVFIAISVGPSLTGPGAATKGPVSTGFILNNVLAAGNSGTGLDVSSQSNDGAAADADTKLRVENNDFNNNAIGVNYSGSAGATIGTDLGGGPQQSLGANNFRSFVTAGTSTHAAIVVGNVGNGAVLKAQTNLFGVGVQPATVVFVAQGLGTTATIDVSSSLGDNQAFVQTLYSDFLGRVAAPAELNYWVAVLTGTGPNTGQAAVVSGISSSFATLTLLVDSYYVKYLGRTGFGEEGYWVTQLQGGTSLETVQAGFASSPEFISRSNSDYVQGLYRTFFRRTGSSSEVAFWYGQLQQPNGLNIVAQGFANSQENKNAFVQTAFLSYLHQTPSPNDFSFWSSQGSPVNIIQGILSSPNFFKHG